MKEDKISSIQELINRATELRGKSLMLERLKVFVPWDEKDIINKELHDEEINIVNKLMVELKKGW